MTLTADMIASAAYEAAKTNTTFTLPPGVSIRDRATARALLLRAALMIDAPPSHCERFARTRAARRLTRTAGRGED